MEPQQQGSESSEIQSILDQAVEGDAPETEGQEPEPAKQQEPEKDDKEAYETRIRDLEGRLAGQGAEISILRDLATRQPTQQPAPDPDDEDQDEPDAEIEKRLRVAPAATIKQLISKASERTAKRVREETLREVEGRSTQKDLFKEDANRVLAEYPEIMEDQEFQSEAAAEYDRLKRLRGGQSLPGDAYSAASVAYAKRARSGKIVPKTNGRRQLVNPIVRGDNPPDSQETRPENEFKPHELAEIDKICKQFGLSRDQYMKRFVAQRKQDSSYGRRLA